MNNKLKRCHYCKNKAEIAHLWVDDFVSCKTTHFWWATCLSCGTRTKKYATEEEAANNWNEKKYERNLRKQAYGTAIGLYRSIAGLLWRTWLRWKY